MKNIIQEIFILQDGCNMDEFYYEEESNGKLIFIKCLILLFIIGICIGIFLFYKKQNTIKIKNITVELGTELSTDVEDYLVSGKNNSKNYKLYLNDVDKETVGTYTYKVKYNKHTKEGKIKIVDTTKPKVEIENNITIGVNEEINPKVFINKCEDYSLPCEVKFKDNNIIDKFKTPGTYKVDLIVSDSYGNSVNLTSNVTVSENATLTSEKTKDLNYSYNSLDKEIGKTLFVKFDKAMDEDSEEFESIYSDVTIEDFSQYTNDIYDTKLVTAYNKYGYVIGIQVLVTHSSGTEELIERVVVSNEEETEE